ncbi:hypothetical protein BA895_11115 [Humibacillus sp. DSM 29435]|uniref:hypothetical protein n=1 Tax=Humibacillus sp. DSM 29435 TaxID=1869167 RepID=UPI0008722D87|nr:hypothetical protein [Humibacillus sp. DSM 29435]OFE14170.1 hypothetical protein BA895_11115 [Humibacillus sp. DSM 29435]
MGRIKRTVLGVTAAGALVLAGLGGPASAATAVRDIAPPQLRIKDVGDPLGYGQAILTLSVRCFGGALVEKLPVTITQGQLAGADDVAPGNIVCDGVRRDVLVAPGSDDGEPFSVGPAVVTARLTVLDPHTMKPLPEVVSKQSVYLRPYVVVKIATGPVRLNSDGSAIVTASIKCLAPYRVSSFFVTASQNGGRITGNGNGDPENPPCDSTFHSYTFTVHPSKPFVAGGIRVSALGYVFDAETGDPVDWGTADSNRQAVPWGQ